MHEQRRLRFAADLCTFYAPAFWGADAGFDLADIFAGRWEPLAFGSASSTAPATPA